MLMESCRAIQDLEDAYSDLALNPNGELLVEPDAHCRVLEPVSLGDSELLSRQCKGSRGLPHSLLGCYRNRWKNDSMATTVTLRVSHPIASGKSGLLPSSRARRSLCPRGMLCAEGGAFGFDSLSEAV